MQIRIYIYIYNILNQLYRTSRDRLARAMYTLWRYSSILRARDRPSTYFKRTSQAAGSNLNTGWDDSVDRHAAGHADSSYLGVSTSPHPRLLTPPALRSSDRGRLVHLISEFYIRNGVLCRAAVVPDLPDDFLKFWHLQNSRWHFVERFPHQE